MMASAWHVVNRPHALRLGAVRLAADLPRPGVNPEHRLAAVSRRRAEQSAAALRDALKRHQAGLAAIRQSMRGCARPWFQQAPATMPFPRQTVPTATWPSDGNVAWRWPPIENNGSTGYSNGPTITVFSW